MLKLRALFYRYTKSTLFVASLVRDARFYILVPFLVCILWLGL